MPIWPGGPCPQCQEEMPENLIHCQSCRTLLNTDLEADSVEIPEFIPLKEIESMVDVAPQGFYIGCPLCKKELRIHQKYEGEKVQCRHCEGRFLFDRSDPKTTTVAFYCICPHCEEEIRAAIRYMGIKVACKLCGGRIQLLEEAPHN